METTPTTGAAATPAPSTAAADEAPATVVDSGKPTAARSIVVSYIGWRDAIVQQTLLRLRGRSPENAVADFAADHPDTVSKVVGWHWWA